MIYNYFKIALRNFKKYKIYSFINVFGLALGFGTCVLILMWVVDESSYDNFHKNGESIYRVTYAEDIGGEFSHYALAPFPCGPAFKDEIPEVINFTRFLDRTGLIKIGNKKFDVTGITYVDSTFLNIFSFPLLKGDINTALSKPNSIVLTKESAEKIFGKENPMGKMLEISGLGNLYVTGIVEDCPKNSHFNFNCLIPWITLEQNPPAWINSWFTIGGWVYLQLDKSANLKAVEEKMAAVVDNHIGQQAKELDYKLYYYLQNIKDIHLNSHLMAEFGPNGDADYIRLFSAVAIFILLLACINFTNLSTAKSIVRSKEVGLRKVLGAHRIRLVYQFIIESVILTGVAFIIAIFVITAALPLFNKITAKDFSFSILSNPLFLFGLLGLLFLTGVMAGAFPAFHISSYQPVAVLNNLVTKGLKRSRIRNILVVFQFVISLLLSASTLIILQQLDFMKGTKLGFDKDQVLLVKVRGRNFNEQAVTFKNELMQNKNIKYATYANGVPGDVGSILTVFQKGKSKSESINTDVILCDFGLVEALNLQLISGRDFSPLFVSDTSGAFIVNETMANKLGGIDECIGKYIGFSSEQTQPIVGVVKDFHYESVKYPIGAMAIKLVPEPFRYMVVKISSINIKETISYVKKLWKKIEPDRSFNYTFLDKKFEEQYKSENRVSEIVLIFAILSAIIACLGLFGLSSYIASQRTKEIGIRKVLGGTSSQITFLISGLFLKQTIIANLIALPLAYIILDKYWLPNFAVRINISFVFLCALGIVSLLIAFITVSFQSIKAALANPVESLKYE